MENNVPRDDYQPAPPRGGVQAADTALSILETVAFAQEPLGVTQIAAALGTAKGATFRYLQTLVDRGYLVQDPVSSRFRLGLKAFSLARNAPVEWDLAALLAAPMRQLRDATGLSVVLSTPTLQGACVLATIPGTKVIEIGVRVGSTLAFHASAQGKIFLAFDRLARLDQMDGSELTAFTERTITSKAALLAEIGTVRQQGYATAPEEVLPGVNTLAVPVFDKGAVAVAALALVGSIQHIAAQPDPALVTLMANLGATASRLVSNSSQ
jgi:IclR family KDG regulon transcriptional repressor